MCRIMLGYVNPRTNFSSNIEKKNIPKCIVKSTPATTMTLQFSQYSDVCDKLLSEYKTKFQKANVLVIILQSFQNNCFAKVLQKYLLRNV